MNLKREESSNKPRVLIFIAPKRKVEDKLSEFLELLKKRRWRILQVISIGTKIKHDILGQCDFVITLGGDGTILHASREIALSDIPILGINFGKIGLLTELSLNTFIDSLDKIEKGDYGIVALRRLEAKVYGKNMEIPTVLNEYVIMTGKPGKILGLDIFVDGEFLTRVLCDGLIVSTPIGSSSYSLSSGGPVLLETMNALVLSPLAPLFRGMFPVVLPSDSRVAIEIVELWADAIIVADGVIVGKLERGERIEIGYSNLKTRFIRLGEKYDRLRRIINMVSIQHWLNRDEDW